MIVGIPIGVGLLFYFVPKKLGFPKTAKVLTILFSLMMLIIVVFIVFQDQLFTKNNAKDLVEEQNFKLTDEFVLLKNESKFIIGNYYHTFTLKISDRDKQDAITKIESSANFKSDNESVEILLYQKVKDKYYGNKIIQNYETETSYVREYFEPSGRQGFAFTFRRISISKTKNELTFEDIAE